MKRLLITAVMTSVFFMGCERRPANILAPTPNQDSKTNPNGKQPAQNDEAEDINGSGQLNTLRTELLEDKFKGYNVDLNNLNFKFSFGDVKKDGSIKFTNGKSELTFPGLPSGKAADLVLEIYEGTKLQFKAVKTNLILAPGSQRIELKPDFVGGVIPPGVADLVLSVEIDQGIVTPTSLPTGVIVPTVIVPTVTPINPTPTPVDPTPTPASLFNWDGVSFKGNEKWNIVPVQ